MATGSPLALELFRPRGGGVPKEKGGRRRFVAANTLLRRYAHIRDVCAWFYIKIG